MRKKYITKATINSRGAVMVTAPERIKMYEVTLSSLSSAKEAIAILRFTDKKNELKIREVKVNKEGNATRYQMELKAISKALEHLNTKAEFVLIINPVDKLIRRTFEQGWIRKWENSNWTNAKGKPVQESLIWQEISKKLGKCEYIVK